jgi:two-component system, cell cycle sensor histidine kinase and response regulator CckA
MQSDPLFAPVDPEVLVTSIDPETGLAQPNPEWLSVLGSADDPFGAMDEPDAADARRLVKEASEGRMTTAKLFLLTTPADPRPVLLNFIPVHLADRTSGFPVVVTGEILEQPGTWTANQTEQHRMETLGRMTMGIAHDFNNLLSGIIGHAELMQSALGRDLDVEVLQEHVSTIRLAAKDSGDRIKTLQTYIRKEQKAAFIPLDLPSIIQDCVVLTRPYWYNEPRRQGIAITVDQDLGRVPSIMGSAAELRDVLVNLILNAVQAMPGGGVLKIRSWHSEERVVISVADTGVGMSPAVRARIFEPMYTTKGEGGNGMGLAVTSGVVQEHGGTIDVDSSLGVGTCFTLRFPVGLDQAVRTEESGTGSKAEPADLPRASNGVRVLVVDDEPMVRSVLRKLLALRGHTVIEADSGAEALSILQNEQFDVIVTDQGMPEMNGREFARRTRALLPDIPIVLLTGDTHTGTTDASISAVLAKPFKIDEVEGTITDLAASTA